MIEHIVNANDAGQRLDKFLQKAYPKLPKSKMYKGIRSKKIKVNRKRAQFDQPLQAGDSILLFLPPDLLEGRNLEQRISASSDLDVVYEDDDLLIVNKPAGLLSQKDQGSQQDALSERIIAYLYKKGEYDPRKESSFVPSAIHRLDRNTSGLVVAAKTAAALRLGNEAIRDHTLHKYYRALVEGVPQEGEVTLYMKKEGTQALVKDEPAKGYEPAVMDIKVLEQNGKRALIEIDLRTGRFHQIRAGMAHLGHPLVGDHKYGWQGKESVQQLQACRLDFSQTGLHPKNDIIEIPSSIVLR